MVRWSLNSSLDQVFDTEEHRTVFDKLCYVNPDLFTRVYDILDEVSADIPYRSQPLSRYTHRPSGDSLDFLDLFQKRIDLAEGICL
jgi:hypothetical protein